MTEPANLARIGDVVGGKYRLEDVLGRGGMCVVFRAHHVAMSQRVAIKVLREEHATPRSVARFLGEADALSKFRGEHFARVFDVSRLETGAPFIVMELLEGIDLGRALAAGVRFSIEEAAGYVLEALEAIAEAHAAGVVHRDLKPSNLFRAELPGGATQIKVLDFGVSHLRGDGPSSSAATTAEALLGSPAYMAPEQIVSSKNADARSDIWSIGVVLFELSTGVRPFEGGSVGETLAAVLRDRAPLLRSLRPDAPEELEAVVARCLEPDAEKRFADVAALARAIAPFARGGEEAAARVDQILRARAAEPALKIDDAGWTASRWEETLAEEGSRANRRRPAGRARLRWALAMGFFAVVGAVGFVAARSSRSAAEIDHAGRAPAAAPHVEAPSTAAATTTEGDRSADAPLDLAVPASVTSAPHTAPPARSVAARSRPPTASATQGSATPSPPFNAARSSPPDPPPTSPIRRDPLGDRE